jgi:hypothetical protein
MEFVTLREIFKESSTPNAVEVHVVDSTNKVLGKSIDDVLNMYGKDGYTRAYIKEDRKMTKAKPGIRAHYLERPIEKKEESFIDICRALDKL